MSLLVTHRPGRYPATLHLSLLLAAAATATLADTIDFEDQCPSGQQLAGPCSALFSTVGNAKNLSIATTIGMVTIQGGALFDKIANLPSDETALYGTAGNAAGIGVFPGSGFTTPLTITFPHPIVGFFPTDHYYSRETRFVASVRLALKIVSSRSDTVILLGAATYARWYVPNLFRR